MNNTFLLVASLAFSMQATAQVSGPALLFENSGSRLNEAEKRIIFQKLKLKLAPGGKGLVSEDFPVESRVYPTDLNGDGKEDVFVVLSSAALYGSTGQGYALFLKNAAGAYEMQEGGGAGVPAFLKTKSGGFPDLLLAGPGFEHPVYRWNGKGYSLYRKLKDGSAESKSAQYLEDNSAAFLKNRK